MTTATASQASLLSLLHDQRLLKVIAGIGNTDMDNVSMVLSAANAANAVAVDVAATPEIVSMARAATPAILFASSIDPKALAEAVNLGADVVELGNYDVLYPQGIYLSEVDVLRLAHETTTLVAGRAAISVTIPGHLAADAQVRLAKALEALDITLIQTEGAARMVAATPTIKALTAAEKATIALANTRTLASATSLPVLAASGMSAETVADALAAGACGVGLGSVVNRCASHAEMVQAISATQAAFDAVLKDAARPVAMAM